MMELKEGFTIIKQSIAFHSPMRREIPNFYLGAPLETPFHGWHDSGLLTESGMQHAIDCVAAMKRVIGDKVGLALDCGPGWTLPDAICFARAVERTTCFGLRTCSLEITLPMSMPMSIAN